MVIWSINLPAVEIFERCQPHLASGGGGIFWQGVSAGEVRAACELSHMPVTHWPDILDDVQFMARVVANRANRDAAKDAERRRDHKR